MFGEFLGNKIDINEYINFFLLDCIKFIYLFVCGKSFRIGFV